MTDEIKNEDSEMERSIFLIISYAGDSKSDSLLALRNAGEGNFEEAERLLKEASSKILSAHKIHSKLLQRATNGENVPMNILLTHAQDHFMNACLTKDLVSELIIILKGKKE